VNKYLADAATFPGDARLAWRTDGAHGLWAEFAERTLYRVARSAQYDLYERELATVKRVPAPEGLELEIVQERAVGTEEALARAELSARTTLGWIIATAIATSLAALLASFLVTDETWRLALRAVSLGVVLEELWVYATTYLRALRELRRYALLEIANASVHLIAAVGMALIRRGFRSARSRALPASYTE